MSAELRQALDRGEAFVRRFMVMSDHQHAAVVLWAAHTHMVEALWTTPYLHITSGEYDSGKTRLLFDVLGNVVREPLPTVDTTPADLYRSLDDLRSTLLLDEVDALFTERPGETAEAIRRCLNVGYRRSGGLVRRWNMTNRSHDVFNVFSPKAMAGTGDLPRSLATRSVRIRLKKRLQNEPVEEWIDHEGVSPGQAVPIREALADAAETMERQLAKGRPLMPEGVRDRAADIWTPLFAVADAAGEDWSERARRAAVALMGNANDADASVGIRLLADLREAMHELGDPPRVLTAELLERLLAWDDSQWRHYPYKEPLDGTSMASLLRRYDVAPRVVRAASGRGRGYWAEHLADAFARYLPPDRRDARDNPHGSALFGDSGGRDTTPGVTPPDRPGYADVTGVTGLSPGTGAVEVAPDDEEMVL